MTRAALVTYGGSAIPLIGRAAFPICEWAVSMQPPDWLTALPWTLVGAISASLWIGQLLADLRNHQSWLRRALRRNFRLFDVIESPGRHGNASGFNVRLMSIRKIRSATIFIRVNGYHGGNLLTKKDIRIAKGEELTIRVLALTHIEGNRYMMWNPDGMDGQSAQGAWGFQYIAKVEMQSSWSHWNQSLTFYVKIPTIGSHHPGVDVINSEDDLFGSLPPRTPHQFDDPSVILLHPHV